jgi:hypothetical protein
MNSEDSEHKYDAESAEDKLEVLPSPQPPHMSHLSRLLQYVTLRQTL